MIYNFERKINEIINLIIIHEKVPQKVNSYKFDYLSEGKISIFNQIKGHMLTSAAHSVAAADPEPS